MGLNVFAFFLGHGVGSLVFEEALRISFGAARVLFATVEFVPALSIRLFCSEMPASLIGQRVSNASPASVKAP
jgi:hypothetical protein